VLSLFTLMLNASAFALVEPFVDTCYSLPSYPILNTARHHSRGSLYYCLSILALILVGSLSCTLCYLRSYLLILGLRLSTIRNLMLIITRADSHQSWACCSTVLALLLNNSGAKACCCCNSYLCVVTCILAVAASHSKAAGISC
jgi:hypothetical protein